MVERFLEEDVDKIVDFVPRRYANRKAAKRSKKRIFVGWLLIIAILVISIYVYLNDIYLLSGNVMLSYVFLIILDVLLISSVMLSLMLRKSSSSKFINLSKLEMLNIPDPRDYVYLNDEDIEEVMKNGLNIKNVCISKKPYLEVKSGGISERIFITSRCFG